MSSAHFLGGAVESVVGMRPVFYISGIAVFIATLAVLFLVKEPKLEVENTTSKEQSKQPVKDYILARGF